MIDSWAILGLAFGYVGLLFAIAYVGDKREKQRKGTRGRPLIYSLSLAVYCTSWTFFGSVGLASTSGLGFLPVYLGAIIMIGLATPLMTRIVRISKNQNITSTADFIAARYGKSQLLAALVTVIAVAGTIPYIALQLKAAALSVEVMLGPLGQAGATAAPIAPAGDIAFTIAITMAAFAVLFGTRHIDATEHQGGLMLAVATESIVKLLAFMAIGLFVTFWMFDGLGDLWTRANASGQIRDVMSQSFSGSRWLTITFLSFICIVLLPRQFHVAVVENQSESDVRTAAWLFPLYLVLINIFVLPIALAGLLTFPSGTVDADMFVLALPLSAGANTLAMVGFIGGLSAATAMVIVASIALAIMVCNEIVVPLMLRRAATRAPERDDFAEIGPLLLNIRRVIIFLVLMLAYGFHRTIGQSQALASIGLLSFAAIAQFAPAFFAGMFWRRATASGAVAGISIGFALWAYTMFLPWIANAGWIPTGILNNGPWGIALLRPEALFGVEMSPLVHGVFWSISTNIAAFIGVSYLRLPHPIERLQANLFLQNEWTTTAPTPAFRLWRTSITVQDLMRTAARYVGTERAERTFAQYAEREQIDIDPNRDADTEMIRFTEHLLASAIGAASSRLVLSLLLRRQNVGHRSALKLLDDASEAIQYNRDLLQSALDQMGQGISVFDKDLQLICWNRRFRELLDLPSEFGAVGVPLDKIIQYKAEAGHYGDVNVEACVAERVDKIALIRETFQDANLTDHRVLEIGTSAMPQGGIVTTYTDITERVESAEALARANESLERRVRDRTAQLTDANSALGKAKRKADEANLDKTRFLAAASHDILQPLNAARLYTSSLSERARGTDADDLAQRIDTSLEAVEEIIGALLDISRLDAGAMEPEFSVFPVADLFERLRLEFEPSASAKKLELRFVATSTWIQSDRRLLRRVLQNLISNAIKYTDDGKVLVGCRHQGENISVQVVDTGKGIKDSDRASIFKEFQRLDKDARKVRGLGLGLSIVQRIANVLGQPITLRSTLDHGSTFSIAIPARPPLVRPMVEKASKQLGHNLTGTVVLVIDNEPEIVRGTEILLSGWGCKVISAGSEAEACALVSTGTEPPDVILADYHLAETLGTDTVTAIRATLGEEIPAIMITADRSQDVQRLVQEMGLTLMRKPVRPAALRAAIYQQRQNLIAAE